MAQVNLKDLPDVTKIDDKKAYKLVGKSYRAIVELLGLLYRGENIGKGDVSPQQMGDAGYNMRGGPPPVVQRVSGGGSTPPHALKVFDARAGGPDGLISVTAGSVTDLTNSSTVWTGASGNIIYLADYLQGNVPFALPISDDGGVTFRQPRLQLDPAATVSYLSATVDESTGFITAYQILGDSGAGMPASTSVLWNYLLSSVAVTTVSSVAKVAVLDDGAQSSLNFKRCGALPLTDGNGYTVGT